jgi:hypothetical protein
VRLLKATMGELARLGAGTEAGAIGYGGVAAVACATGMNSRASFRGEWTSTHDVGSPPQAGRDPAKLLLRGERLEFLGGEFAGRGRRATMTESASINPDTPLLTFGTNIYICFECQKHHNRFHFQQTENVMRMQIVSFKTILFMSITSVMSTFAWAGVSHAALNKWGRKECDGNGFCCGELWERGSFLQNAFGRTSLSYYGQAASSPYYKIKARIKCHGQWFESDDWSQDGWEEQAIADCVTMYPPSDYQCRIEAQ